MGIHASLRWQADRALAGQGRWSIAPVRFTAVAAGSGSSHV
jgi:hypothetical protein